MRWLASIVVAVLVVVMLVGCSGGGGGSTVESGNELEVATISDPYALDGALASPTGSRSAWSRRSSKG